MLIFSSFGHFNLIFENLQIFADSKSRAEELFNYVTFVIFRHQTWDSEGGGGQIKKNHFVKNKNISNFEGTVVIQK